jgi:hypothetical protein
MGGNGSNKSSTGLNNIFNKLVLIRELKELIKKIEGIKDKNKGIAALNKVNTWFFQRSSKFGITTYKDIRYIKQEQEDQTR